MTYSTLALLQIAATADFRPLADSHLVWGFQGAPEGTLVADNHPDVLVLHAPKTDLDDERLEFHGVDAEGAPFCTVIEVSQAL